MPASPYLSSKPHSVEPKVRRSREELRDLILDAGRDVLLSEGLGSGAEHLTFKRVLAHVEATQGIRVTNASVIRRIWDNQNEFQLEVIRSIVNAQGDAEVAATSQVLNYDDIFDHCHTTSIHIYSATHFCSCSSL